MNKIINTLIAFRDEAEPETLMILLACTYSEGMYILYLFRCTTSICCATAEGIKGRSEGGESSSVLAYS